MASRFEGPCKIGISVDPDARRNQLQTGHPEVLIVYHREPVLAEQIKLYETLVHKHIKHIRTHGEWFNFSVEKAIQQVQWTLIHYADIGDSDS